MSALLSQIRDFLIALALAWVGISFEPKTPEAPCMDSASECSTAQAD
jgi:hypothetical protein